MRWWVSDLIGLIIVFFISLFGQFSLLCLMLFCWGVVGISLI